MVWRRRRSRLQPARSYLKEYKPLFYQAEVVGCPLLSLKKVPTGPLKPGNILRGLICFKTDMRAKVPYRRYSFVLLKGAIPEVIFLRARFSIEASSFGAAGSK